MPEHVEVYRREDGRWDWRRISANGNVISTSGGQGYENLEDARGMATELNYDVPIEIEGDEDDA